ncbi:HECT domain-containing ubiquitin-transferase [Hamiltosporidium magnivora]|uniref:HECT-type E3 ubiquitin transferase n=1 Tax=Hamiltosporidium magnivora TaxID=148818 RepID=A0A4Q9LGX9_9MICR|nr:HECT domain-containing ubiquitin-transferase [Hamiltosporidium magnivora]
MLSFTNDKNSYLKKYTRQLDLGCKLNKCCRIFCKRNMSRSCMQNIGKMLAKYGSVFYCENICLILQGNEFSNDYISVGCRPLDFFFYLTHILFDEDFIKVKNKGCTSQKSENCDTLINKKLNHEFCEYFNSAKFGEEDIVLIEGLLYLLLKKYEFTLEQTLGLVIIRIFNVVSRHYTLKNVYVQLFTNTFLNIQRLSKEISKDDGNECCCFEDMNKDSISSNISNESNIHSNETLKSVAENESINTISSVTKISACKSPDNYNSKLANINLKNILSAESNHTSRYSLNSAYTSNDTGLLRECIFKSKITKKDFINLVNSVSLCINSMAHVNIRESACLENLFNIFNILYTINDQEKILNYKKFYSEEYCKSQNFKEEFRSYKANFKSMLKYTFILPLRMKAEFIKSENSDMMKSCLQDMFFRALFEGETKPYLFITVGRSTIYRDTMNILKNLDDSEMKKQLKITFDNEEGVDSGGIRKEYFQLLSEEITNDHGLFEIKNNYLWFKITDRASDNLREYETIGKLIGIALYNDVVLNIPFPSVFFKKLLSKRTNTSDLQQICPDIFQSLYNLKKCQNEELKELEQTFEIAYSTNDIEITHFLVENGNKVMVDCENVNEFTEKYADFILNESISAEFESLKKGFFSIVKHSTVSYLHSKELEKIIVGTTFIDVEAIHKHALNTGFDENSSTLQNFWEIFTEFDSENRKKLLQFITGNDRIPVSGPESLKLVIMKNGCDTDRLPSSQTCFNTLLLPEYSSKEKLKSKLLSAIHMTKGFFLL